MSRIPCKAKKAARIVQIKSIITIVAGNVSYLHSGCDSQHVDSFYLSQNALSEVEGEWVKEW